MSPEEYCVRVLRVLFDSINAAIDEKMMLLDYSQLTPSSMKAIADYFQLRGPSEGTAAFEPVFRFHSKNLSRVFANDIDRKRAMISESMTGLAGHWASSIYDDLRRRALSSQFRHIVQNSNVQ